MNNFVNLIFFSTKLSGIDPYKKCINILNGHAWRHFFMACSKLEAMVIYVVKSANANDILASVYILEETRAQRKWHDKKENSF